jgi:hypothetical protein
MLRLTAISVLTAITILIVAPLGPAQATTYDLPLDGTISINTNGATGPIAIGVQAVESFALPTFNQQSPQTTVGVYQWVAKFSIFDSSGAQVSEPSLSPLGTALTGYGQNCYVSPYCPRASGPSSVTVLSGTLFLSGDSVLDLATTISGMNIVSESLQLLLTLPDGFTTDPALVDPPSPTPLPAALPLFATGLALGGLAGWRNRRRKRQSAVPRLQ